MEGLQTMRVQVRRLAMLGACGAAVSCVAAAALLYSHIAQAPSDTETISAYATSLDGRTWGQRHNAMLAAEQINGQIVAPGAVFSFNRAIRSWSVDRGYVKAPVSFNGELVPAFGGGVCQVSTTLYNAALLAGLKVVERHPHVFAAHYAPPGQDAAVAQPDIDLRFSNPYPWPIRLRANATGGRIRVAVEGQAKPSERISVHTQILDTVSPAQLTCVVPEAGLGGRPFVRNPGAVGYRVITYRSHIRGGHEVRRERLSDDTYRPMNRVVALGAESSGASEEP